MRGFRHWQWHLDGMYMKVNGEMAYLLRAVDHEGEVLESHLTRTRDKAAALRSMTKALKRRRNWRKAGRQHPSWQTSVQQIQDRLDNPAQRPLARSAYMGNGRQHRLQQRQKIPE